MSERKNDVQNGSASGLRRTDRHAEHFTHAVGVHANGDYYRHGHDAPGLPNLHVRCVEVMQEI
jgi:hypothetical protein